MSRLAENVCSIMVQSMPIPCVDVIVEKNREILVGLRVIDPCKNVWTLPGGRILKHEWPEEAVMRNLKEINVSAHIRDLVGVFPVRFANHPQKRYDITLCYKCEWKRGEPKRSTELTRFKWISPGTPLAGIGGNHRKMIQGAFSIPSQGGRRQEVFQAPPQCRSEYGHTIRATKLRRTMSWGPEPMEYSQLKTGNSAT